jgi:long-chain acyl-CoA synthetase
MMRDLPSRWPKMVHRGAKKVADKIDKIDDNLDTIERLIDLYLPFIYENHFIFTTDNLLKYDVVEEPFRFDPTALNWRTYWINVHIPGLRKWCYPLFEGRTPEQYRPRHKFVLGGEAPADPPVKTSAAAAPAAAHGGSR